RTIRALQGRGVIGASNKLLPRLKLMNFWLRITHIPRNFDNMPVMSQIDRLTAPADPLHETAGGTRSILIEGLKDIVAEEGELNALRYHLFIGRGAQRQIELEPRPL